MEEKNSKEITLADFHCHVYDHHDIVFNPKFPLIGNKHYRGFPSVTGFINYGGKTPEENLIYHSECKSINTLIGIINFDDERAQDLLESIKRVSEHSNLELKTDVPGFISLRNTYSGNLTSFIAGQELDTDRGHLLIVGNSKNIRNPRKTKISADYAIDVARKTHSALILPNFELNEQTVINNRDSIDALCFYDGNFRSLNSTKISKLAAKINKPLYASSDSHTISPILSTGTYLQDLKLDSRISLLESIRSFFQSRTQKDFVLGSNGLFEPVRHKAGILGITLPLLKSGILKRKE